MSLRFTNFGWVALRKVELEGWQSSLDVSRNQQFFHTQKRRKQHDKGRELDYRRVLRPWYHE